MQTAGNAGFITVGIADETSASDREEIIANSDYYLDGYENLDGFLDFILTK